MSSQESQCVFFRVVRDLLKFSDSHNTRLLLLFEVIEDLLDGIGWLCDFSELEIEFQFAGDRIYFRSRPQ